MLNFGRGGGMMRGRGGRGGGPGGDRGDRFDGMRDSPGMGRGGMDGPPRGFGNSPFGGPPRGFDDGRDEDFGMRDAPPFRGGPHGPPGRFGRDEPPPFRGPPGGGPGPRESFGGRGGRDEPPSFGPRDNYGPWAQAPPTHPPSLLSIPHQQRTNDVEIIVINKSLTEYGELIEQKLKSLAFSVDLLFPNEEVPLPKVLANIASRGTLFAILVTPLHQQHRSLTLNILHGSPQEHRNMPMEDAITLISRNYEMYVLQCNEKQGLQKPPEDIRAIMEQRLAGTVTLTSSQLDKLVLFFTQEKAKSEMPGAGGPPGGPLAPPPIVPTGTAASLQEQDLQNRILNILNKGPSNAGQSSPSTGPPKGGPPGGGPGGPPPSLITPGKPLLNDPSVQKALDSLMQGFNPGRMPMNR